jgi:branched-chain amino acid transport system substrate-binding protein
MKKGKKIILVLILTVFISLGLIASSAIAEIGVSDTEIKIGFFGALTGPPAFFGTATRNGAMIVFNEVNAAGGIHGRKINFIVEDSACAPPKAIAAVKKLLTRDKVFAVYGGNCSSSTLATLPLFEKDRVPLYTPMASAPTIMQPFRKNVFRTTLTQAVAGHTMVDFAMEKYSPKKVAVSYIANDYGIETLKAIKESLKKYNMVLSAEESHKRGDTDLSSQVLRIKAVSPDVVFMATYVSDSGTFLRLAQELGLDAKFMVAPGGSTPVIFKMAGKDALIGKYVGTTSAVDVEEGPKLAGFRNTFFEAYPDMADKPGSPNFYDVLGYGGAKIFVEGLKRAGKDLTREKFIAALETLKDFETEVLPPVTFTTTDHEGDKDCLFWVFNEDGSRKLDGKRYTYSGN